MKMQQAEAKRRKKISKMYADLLSDVAKGIRLNSLLLRPSRFLGKNYTQVKPALKELISSCHYVAKKTQNILDFLDKKFES